MSVDSLRGPEPLVPDHDLGSFDCGVPALNDYLATQALADQRAGKTRTYVALREDRVVAYFSLAAGSVRSDDAPSRIATGQGRQAIPVILLVRLAVDAAEQGRRLGEAMLVDALARSCEAAETIGARAILVHAKDDEARAFYARYAFEQSPTDPLHLMLLMKDVRKTLEG